MITAYVKPTNYCNVGCTHCYLPESIRANKNLMTIETLEATANLLVDMAASRRLPLSAIHILWHGGEPMTVPIKWYNKALKILDNIIPDHSMSMQTSLIPFKDDYIEFLQERCAGEVGTSIDFSQRMIKGKVENYHRLWMQKVEACRAADIFVIAGVVPTTNEIGKEKQMVKFFVDRDFPMFNIDRYNAYNTYFDDRPSNAKHAQFLIGLFDALMEEMDKRGRAPMVGAIKGGLTGVLFGYGGDRWGTTCQSDFVVVEPNGGLNTCPDKSTVEDPFSFAKDGFDAFAKSQFRRKWIRTQAIDHKKPHCASCENQHFCQSGCPITPNGAPDGEDECSGYWTFLNHVRKYSKNEENKARMIAYIDQKEFAVSPYDAGRDDRLNDEQNGEAVA